MFKGITFSKGNDSCYPIRQLTMGMIVLFYFNLFAAGYFFTVVAFQGDRVF